MASPTDSAVAAASPTRGQQLEAGAKQLTTRFLRSVESWINNEARRARLVISFVVSVPLVALLFYYSHGALLYRVDYVGLYSPAGFLWDPTPNYVIPAFVSIFTGANFVAIQYASLFLEAFLCAYGAQLLAREMFYHTFSDRWLIGVQILTAAFYLYNPYNITWGYYAITFQLLLSNAAIFVVFAYLLRFVRVSRSGKRFSTRDAVVLGICVGLSAPVSFPNVVRVIGIEVIAFLFALAYLLLTTRKAASYPFATKSLRTVLLFSAPIAVLLLAYPIYQFVVEWVTHPATIHSAVGLFGAVNPNATSFLNAIRQLDGANFRLMAYRTLFDTNLVLLVASYLWPAMIFIVPMLALFYLKLRDRIWIIAAMIIAFLSMLWGAAAAPPLGFVYVFITGHVPYGPSLVSPDGFTRIIGTKVDAVLAAFSVAMIYLGLRREQKSRELVQAATLVSAGASPEASHLQRLGRGRVPVVAGVVVILVSGMLLATAAPLYNGDIFETEHTTSYAGFTVPATYMAIRALLLSGHSNALLLPQLEPYIETSWGYVGATGFYDSLMYPSLVVVPGYYGQYGIATRAVHQAYINATHPLYPGTGGVPLTVAATANWTSTTNTTSNITSYRIVVDTGALIANYSWVDVGLTTTQPTYLVDQITAGNVTLALVNAAPSKTNKFGNYSSYDFGALRNSFVLSVTGDYVEVALEVWAPDQSVNHWKSDWTLNNLTLEVAGVPFGPPLQLGVPSLTGVSSSTYNPAWVSLMEEYHVQYILIDYTIAQAGVQYAPGYLFQEFKELNTNGLISTVIVPQVVTTGKTVGLYKIIT